MIRARPLGRCRAHNAFDPSAALWQYFVVPRAPRWTLQPRWASTEAVAPSTGTSKPPRSPIDAPLEKALVDSAPATPNLTNEKAEEQREAAAPSIETGEPPPSTTTAPTANAPVEPAAETPIPTNEKTKEECETARAQYEFLKLKAIEKREKALRTQMTARIKDYKDLLLAEDSPELVRKNALREILNLERLHTAQRALRKGENYEGQPMAHGFKYYPGERSLWEQAEALERKRRRNSPDRMVQSVQLPPLASLSLMLDSLPAG